MQPPYIRAIAADDDYVWVGLASRDIWGDFLLADIENRPSRKALALRQGGLVRWNRHTGETKTYMMTDGLPHPWVSTLAVSPDQLWVGTLGGGLGTLNVRTGEWTVWTETNGLPMNMVQALAIEGDTLWVGMGLFDRGGVAKLSLRTHEWRSMMPADFPAKTNASLSLLQSPNLPDYFKQALIVTDVPVTLVIAVAFIENRLWCSVPAVPNRAPFFPYGTLVCDLNTNGWYRASGETPGSFARLNGRVWMALGASGLASCDLKGGDWQRITPADGLPMPAGALAVWRDFLLVAAEGVMLFDPAGKMFHVLQCNEPGPTRALALAGNTVYLARDHRILRLELDKVGIPETSKTK